MNSKYFSVENQKVLQKLISYIFSITGKYGERERLIVSTLNLFYKENNPFLTSDVLYNNEIVLKNDILQSLKKIADEEELFYVILQAFLILSADGMSEFKKTKMIDFISRTELSADKIYILYDIFNHDRLESKNDILTIGNDRIKDDFALSNFDINGYVISVETSCYVFFRNISVGNISANININGNLAYDFLVYPISQEDVIALEDKIVKLQDINNRLGLKRYQDSYVYSLLKKEGNDDILFFLEPGQNSNAFGYLEIKGCHTFIQNLDAYNYFSYDAKKAKNGSIDESIYINKIYKFNAADNIERILNYRPIYLQNVSYEITLIGTDRQSGVYLDNLGDETAEFMLEKKDGSVWDLTPIILSVTAYLNGVEFSDKVNLKSGDVLRIKDSYIYFDPKGNIISYTNAYIRSIDVKNLSYNHKDGKEAISNISFSNKSGDMCCIMGPSGVGKTTLIKLLANFFLPAAKDSILCNKLSLIDNFSNFKNYIGYVSQEDVLFENCTVYENMYHYGKIKNPLKDKQILDKKIDEILTRINLQDKKNQTVGNINNRILSGGERKRLNIALELLSDTDILLLDEPTSGLSSYDSEKIIDLLYDVSKLGKIIYVVIHQPSRDIFLKFSHLLLLDRGGYLAYFGSTVDSFYYFSKFSGKYPRNPDDIISILEQSRKTPDGKTIYDEKSKNKKPLRVRTPEQWDKEFKFRSKIEIAEKKSDGEPYLPPRKKYKGVKVFIQFFHLFLRNILNKFKERRAVVLSIILPLAMGALAQIFRYKSDEAYVFSENIQIPKYLFLTSIVVVFLAISNSINEILNEKVIIEKERLIGYSYFSYYISKLIYLLIVAFYQIVIYVAVSFLILKIPIFNNFIFFLKFIFLSLIGAASTSAVGLFISSFLKSEKQAFMMIPVFIIPQIVFGGMFINFNDMQSGVIYKGRPVPEICDAMHSRWTYESYLALFQNEKVYNREVNKIFINYNMRKNDDGKIKTTYPIVYVFNRKLEYIQTNGDKLSGLEIIKNITLGNTNIFPSVDKILYYKVINAYQYNLLVLVFIFLLFSMGCYIKLTYR